MGDELLKVVAKHISAQAKRESDIIARHGGEDVTITTQDQMLEVREALGALLAEPGRYVVDVENFESIHAHSAVAQISRG